MTDCNLEIADVCALVIDVQERFVPAIPQLAADGSFGRALGLLLRGLHLFATPLLLTEQYPQGLGPTLPWVVELAGDAPRPSKLAFSCLDDEAIRDALVAMDRPTVIVAGIEAHVCVLGSVDDLLRRGWRVVVAADAVASRDPAHGELALATMRQLGAVVLPVESILFRLQRRAGDERFKALSRLVRSA